jgi:hypothetical protein
VFAYLAFYALLHWILRGKVTIGFISWFHLINVKVNLKKVRISARSISMQIRPMYYLHRKKLKATHHDGLIVIHFYKLKVSLLSQQNNDGQHSNVSEAIGVQKPPKSHDDPSKFLKILQYLRWVLPLTIVLHDFSIVNGDDWVNLETFSASFNCDLITNKSSNQRELRHSIHFSISNLFDRYRRIVTDLKWTFVASTPLESACTVKFTKIMSSCAGHRINVNIDELIQLLSSFSPKNVEATGHKATETNAEGGTLPGPRNSVEILDKIVSKLGKCEIYFTFDETRLQFGDTKISLKSFVHSVHSTDTKDIHKKFATTNLYKITLNISSLTVTSDKYKSSKLQIEFYNFLCIWDVTSIVFCAQNIHDVQAIKRFTADDSFIARNFLTITNSTVFTNVHDIMLYNKERRTMKMRKSTDMPLAIPQNNEKHTLIQNLLRLAHKLRVRAQLLTTSVQVNLSDSINCQVSVDDVLLDSSISENVTSLFKCGAYYSSTRSFFTALRNIQLSINVDYTIHKMLIFDLFDISFSVSMSEDSVVIDNVTSYINHIEFLAEEVELFQALSKIAQEIVDRLDSEWAEVATQMNMAKPKLNVDLVDISESGSRESPRGTTYVPQIFHSFKFTIHKITMSACFRNPVKYWDGEDQSSLNNYKRGVCFMVQEFVVTHDNTVEIPVSDIKLRELRLSLVRDYDKEKTKGHFLNILKLSNPHLKYTFSNHRLSSVLPIIDGTISVEVLWTIIFVITILKSLTGRRDDTSKVNLKQSAKRHKNNGPALDILLGLPLVMLRIDLPSDVSIAIELDSFQYSKLPSVNDFSNIKFKVLRAYVQNPQADNIWTLLAIISHCKVKILPEHLNQNSSEDFVIDCDNFRIEIPYQYVFYKTFDNFKAFFKSIKKLKKNFHNIMFIEDGDRSFQVDVIKPTKAEKPMKFPKIKVAAKHLSYCNNDDPFEEELTSLIMLAKMEQHIRISKQQDFEKYQQNALKLLREKYKDVLEFDDDDVALMPQSLKDNVLSPIPASVQASQMRKSFSTGIVSHSKETQNQDYSVSLKLPSKLSSQAETEECKSWLDYQREYHTAIVVPKNRLNANISKSWITRVRASQKMKTSCKRFDGSSKTDPKVRKELLRKFPVVVEGNTHALFEFKVENCILELDVPDFGLENYPNFIYNTAGGVPKDTEYGILAPMNLNLAGSELTIQIKDYPLPMLSFGGNKDDGPETVRVHGDLVICEQMYIEEEIRHNFVTCVPQYNDPRERDSLYAFHICRTMTDVKFITDLHFHVDSSKEAIVSWSPSFQPGLGYAFNSFDLLSKPPLDISPKIAFWDKFPLLIPSKFTFHLKNGIALFIKSSQSPYKLIGKNSGLAFRWDNDVKISINKNGLAKDFMIVESEVFEIVVPAFDPTYVSKFLRSHSPSSRDYKIAKVLLRLTSKPIIWKLGFEFERNANGKIEAEYGTTERSNIFRPHYDVRLRNPATFSSDSERDSWDSYEGWRSSYLYMAISLYSRDDNKCTEIPSQLPGTAYNSLYLTPGAFVQFFYWWDSFKSSLGLPIKEGTMFKNKFLSDKKSPKFGASIFGISYTMDLSPLYISHLYKHASTSHHGSKVAFTGLKCFVKSFSMDLHQTRKKVSLLDEKNDTVNVDYRLKLDKGVVDFVDADLRILTAVFNQNSTEGILARELGIENASSTILSDSDTASSTSDNYTERVWYDHNDFVELETQKVPDEEPKWMVYEFASSPRFYYVRDNPSADVDFPFDAVETHTHHCVLGKRDLSQAATSLIDARLSEVNDQVRFFSGEVEDLSSKPTNEYIAKTIASMKADLKELHHRVHILRCLKDRFSEGVFPEYDEFIQDKEESDDEVDGDVSRAITRASSRVSSHVSRVISGISACPVVSSNYRNRFSLYTINIKWTSKTKSGFLRYLESLKDRRFIGFSLSQHALNLADSLRKSVNSYTHDSNELPSFKTDPAVEFENSRKILDDIDLALHDTTGLNGAETDDSYLIKFILPQISVTSSNDKCLLLTSNQIVLRSITVLAQKPSETETENMSLPMETRTGLVITDAFLYALDKQAILTNKIRLFNQRLQLWPPKLPIEMYYTPASLDECVVMQDLSCALLHNTPNELHYSPSRSEEHRKLKETIRVIAPEINIVSNSAQFETICDVAISLFQHDETEIYKVKESVKSFVKYSDFSDFDELYETLNTLQSEARQLLKCRGLLVNVNYADTIDVTDDISATNVELEKALLNMNALVDILQTTKAKKFNELHKYSQWNFMAATVKILFVDDDRKPFVEISAIDAFYMFTQSPTGESANTGYVYDFAIFDKHPAAMYEQVVVRSRDVPDPMVRIDWSLLPPVGGIKVVQNKVIKMAPLKVEFDMRFAHAFQNFLFPKSEILGRTAFSDSEIDGNLFDDLDSVNSDASSILKLDSVSSEISIPSPEKEGSKISKALHKFMHKNEKAASYDSASQRASRKSSLENNKSTGKSSGPLNCATNKLEIMDTRSGKYYMVKSTVFDSIDLTVTFKGSGKYALVNLTNLHVNTPRIEVTDKLMSNEEFFAMTRNKLVVFVLKNTHNIIKSTFRISKSSKGASSNPKINPILKMKEKIGNVNTSLTNESSAQQHSPVGHSHRHHVHTHKFHDTDLLGPSLESTGESTERPAKRKFTLQDIMQQDQKLANTIDENKVFQPLGDVDEGEES